MLSKLMQFIAYLQIVLYGLWKCWTKSYSKESSNKILVIMDQVGVGDAVCSLNAFYNITHSIENKYDLYIATTPSVIRFLEESHSTFNAQFVTLDLNKDTKFSLYTFRKNQQKISTHNWHQIISLNRVGNYMKLQLVSCRYNSLIGMEFIERKINLLERFLGKQLYNYRCLYFHNTTHIQQIYAMICLETLHLQGFSYQNKNYRFYQIPHLVDNPLKTLKKKYCIICPSIATQKDHPYEHRKWPLDRVVEIVNFIMDSSNLTVCLCGVEADRADNEYVLTHAKDSSRIINMTGKTTYKEWIELIRSAMFVFGNDSGYIHLAAYLGVQSFALAGYWNYGRFLPYRGEYVKKEARPIDIRIPMVSCVYCSQRSVNDSTKKQCDHLVRQEGVYKCIWDISVDYVKEKLSASGMFIN